MISHENPTAFQGDLGGNRGRGEAFETALRIVSGEMESASEAGVDESGKAIRIAIGSTPHLTAIGKRSDSEACTAAGRELPNSAGSGLSPLPPVPRGAPVGISWDFAPSAPDPGR